MKGTIAQNFAQQVHRKSFFIVSEEKTFENLKRQNDKTQ